MKTQDEEGSRKKTEDFKNKKEEHKEVRGEE